VSCPGFHASASLTAIPRIPWSDRGRCYQGSEIRPPARGRGAAADEADEHALACNAVLAELPGPRPGQLAAEAPAATAEIGPENGKADILARLINYLTGSLAPEAASLSIPLQDQALRAETLHALIPRLPVDVLSVVLAAAESISDSYHRSLLVEALAHHVPADLAST
jgi:hypothetical protein